ncbi:MAG: PH domain-containing protein [Candidatus Nanohaloarchaea archaeon]
MQTSEASEGLENSVHGDEEIQWTVNPDKLAMAASGIVKSPVGLLFGIFVAPLTAAGAFLLIEQSRNTAILGAAVGFLLPILYMVLSSLAVFAMTVQYSGTDERIIKYRKFMGEKVDSTLLKDIRDAEYSKGFIGNLFDVGTVDIDTGIHSASAELEYVPDPAEVANRVNELSRQAGEPEDEKLEG